MLKFFINIDKSAKSARPFLFSPDLVIVGALVSFIERDKATDESGKMDTKNAQTFRS
jgi:hypothetical protein